MDCLDQLISPTYMGRNGQRPGKDASKVKGTIMHNGCSSYLRSLHVLLACFDLCLFHEYLVDGSFYSIEEQYGIIPFQLDGEGFNKMFILVDRIYPPYF
ncbi:hypothetical protein ACHAXS_000440, partial [Conticribra weissflogii]